MNRKPQYRVIRQYLGDPHDEVVAENLTLEKAQAHYHDPETSSSTCTGEEATERTRLKGPWFDGYVEMYPDPRKRRLSDNFMNLVRKLNGGTL